MIVFLTLAASILAAEFLGYWIHTLLHSEKVPFLSRAHMHHHIHDYAPRANQRSADYRDSGAGRFTYFGLGAEWLVPLVPVTLLWVISLYLVGVSWWLNLLSAGTGLLWGYMMFSVIHRNFHMRESGFLKNHRVRAWFMRVRRLHDIHHHKLTNEGRMPYNMGICFFWFDQLFGTYSPVLGRFNKEGLKQSREVYANFYSR